MNDSSRLPPQPPGPRQQRQARRTALILAAIAVAIYLGYILYTVLRHH